MTDYEYDPDLPYVVDAAGIPIARFKFSRMAENLAEANAGTEVIDTTPKPRVPDDAKYITWVHRNGEPYVAQYWGGESRKWQDMRTQCAFALEDLPGVTPDTVFTVLEERNHERSQ